MIYLYDKNITIIYLQEHNITRYNDISETFYFYYWIFFFILFLIICNFKKLHNYFFVHDYNIINDTPTTPKIKFEEFVDDKNICTICLEDNNNKSVKLECSHVFHKKCINKWIKQVNKNQNQQFVCPLCRTIIV